MPMSRSIALWPSQTPYKQGNNQRCVHSHLLNITTMNSSFNPSNSIDDVIKRWVAVGLLSLIIISFMFVCRKLEIPQTIEKLGGCAGYSKNPGAFENIITVSWLALWVATFQKQRINIQALDPYYATYVYLLFMFTYACTRADFCILVLWAMLLTN